MASLQSRLGVGPDPKSTPCSGRTDIWFPDADDDGGGDNARDRAQERARSEAIARAGCAACPVGCRANCAKTALLGGDKYGVWAGVALPGGQPRKRAELEEAQERLRLIAGLDRCPACWSWFAVADPAVMAAAISGEVSAHRYERLCPSCAAGDPVAATADSELGDVLDLPPSGDVSMRRYWEWRRHGRRVDAGDFGDWLLITPDGMVEGRYASSLARRTFGRGVDRFRRMVGDGWTVRPATPGDWAWNHAPRTVSA